MPVEFQQWVRCWTAQGWNSVPWANLSVHIDMIGGDDEWIKYKRDKRAFVINVKDFFSPLGFNYLLLNKFLPSVTLGALYSNEFYQGGCQKNTREK